MITSLLRAAALTIPGHAIVDPKNIVARSLRASDAMDLLLDGVYPDTIRIFVFWLKNAMFGYLHAHILPLVNDNSQIILSGGQYRPV